jgi:prophage regulatory protein
MSRDKDLFSKQEEQDQNHNELQPRASSDSRMLSKAEILRRTGRTYPTIWRWMREGRFPRARDLNGHPAWPEAEIDEFFAALPLRKLKGE